MNMTKILCALLIATSVFCFAGTDDTGKTTETSNAVPEQYVIGVEDILAVSVWKDQELTRTLPVRPDGFITLPLIGDVMANGRTAAQLRDEITTRLTKYMNAPVVTVSVQEIRSRKINVVGEVMKSGSFPLTQSMTIIDAIAVAGGFKEFAKPSKIYVLRVNANGSTTKLPFNYKEAIRGSGQVLALQSHDTIVVP
jgi:polysaccharide biosynthesis/export protein